MTLNVNITVDCTEAGGTASQAAYAAYAAYYTNENLASPIPADDTIPTNSEGTEILSVSHAAGSADEAVTVHFSGSGTNSISDNALVACLFVDDETTARRVAMANPAGAGYWVNLALDYQYVPGDTVAHTYKIRVGPLGSGTIRLNGSGSVRYFGGAAAATLVVSSAGEPP